ncbi:MAG TPA: hypothetical protein ENN23_01680 [Deltaproteobacteria bacterium]|nr:hypothetical protein [Deltaproteobacteria bacterium]
MIGEIVLVLLFVMFLTAGVKVVSEYQRIAVFRLGRYFGIKGPGLIVIIPIIDKCYKFSIGDYGQLIGDNTGKFKEAEVPVEYNTKIHVGSQIKISGFSNNKIQVTLDDDQGRRIRCEKCGHEMRI